MFTPLGEARPLPFPLKNQVSDENLVDNAGLPDGTFEWPTDSTQRVLFPLYVSLEEYVALSSAIDVGADIAYPLQYIYVMWIWMRQANHSMDICAMVAECIVSSDATKEAIRELIASDPSILETIGETARGGNPAPETTLVSTDDLDALFGAITFLVDTMYDAIVDFNGLAEITTNLRERGALLFEAIPVIETAPVDEVATFIDTIYEDVMEVFDAQWSTTPVTGSRDRIRCGLFCIAKNNGGVITWQQVTDYFWDQVSFVPAGPVAGVIAQFVGFLATGNWTGQAVVDISFANFATAMSVGQQFGDLFFPSMNTLMALGLNNPDPDWTTLCEDCGEPIGDCYDLVNGPIVTTPLNNNAATYGEQIAGQGYKSGSTQMAFTFNIPMTGATQFTIEFNQPVIGTLNLRNANGTQSSPTSINTGTDTFYVVTKAAGVMTANLYIGFIPTGSGGIANYRITDICWE